MLKKLFVISFLFLFSSLLFSQDLKYLTLEELKEFNGKNGNPAYVAVDGVIYDVTDSVLWKGGKHQGRHDAGMDLTNEIKNMSPHGKAILTRLPVIGKLIKLKITLKELSKYDGKNGNPAYVAVDGIIYDVTNSKLWKGGNHKGRHHAGMDLTNEIKNMSPHGKSILTRLPIVGVLIN